MEFADITIRGATPVAAAFDDIYFSQDGGLEETRHVFLVNNGLPERLPNQPGEHFTVGETGFGTGLNFLTLWQAWRDHCRSKGKLHHRKAPGASGRLHFVSVEKFPIHPQQLPGLLAPVASDLAVLPELLEQYRWLVPGWNRFSFSDVELTLFIGDATEGFRDCQASVDAWFLDGFAPARNTELWQPALFQAMARLSHSETTLATYSAAGVVRQGLSAAGFAVLRVAGHGRKRHMLKGRFVGFHGPLPFDRQAYWWQRPHMALGAGSHVAILGTGLAAAELAPRLSLRGVKVTLIAPDNPGNAASGNAQGAVYAKPGLEADPATCWYAQAMAYRFRCWHDQGHSWPGAACGLLHLMPAERWQRLRDALAQHPFGQLAEAISSEEASARAGVNLAEPALWFAASGWLAPRDYCQQRLAHLPQIRSRAMTLTPGNGQERWTVTTEDRQTYDFDAVIVAAGHHSADWPETHWLPLKPVRGQVSSTNIGYPPQTVICGKSYVTPRDGEGHWHFGASFDIDTDHAETTAEDQQQNLVALRALSPDMADSLAGHPTTERAAVRATTPDYLPLAGPAISDHLRQRDPRQLHQPWTELYQPGLFVLTGLGSKGLTSAPLLAEYVVSLMTGEPLPFDRITERRIHAGRHWLRQGFKGQVDTNTSRSATGADNS